MIRSLRLLSAFLLAVASTGCGVPVSQDSFDSTAEAKFLRMSVERLSARDFDWVDSQLDSGIGTSATRSDLERMADELPSGDIVDVQRIGWQISASTSGPRTAAVSAEYTYPASKWVLASATLIGEPDNLRIVGLHVQRLPAPLATIYAFDLRGKSALHYAFLLLAATSAGLSIFALVRCLARRDLRLRWLWAVLILVGLGKFSIQWASGEVSVSLLSFVLPSAMMQRNGSGGPWTLSFGIPVAAVILLTRRRKIPPEPLEPPKREPPKLEVPKIQPLNIEDAV
jgi:hypothetical protein